MGLKNHTPGEGLVLESGALQGDKGTLCNNIHGNNYSMIDITFTSLIISFL